MKKIITLAVLTVAMVFATTEAKAQGPIHFGVKAGLNMSDIGGDLKDTDMRVGYSVGITAEMDLPSNLFLQSGLDFTTKGANQKETLEGLKVESKMNPMYLQLPVHIGYKYAIADDVKLKFSVGPYFAYGIGGKAKFTGSYEGESETEKSNFFGKDAAKKFDMGVGAKVGVELMHNIDISLGYDLGLSNYGRNDVDLKNRNAFLTVGYRIF